MLHWSPGNASLGSDAIWSSQISSLGPRWRSTPTQPSLARSVDGIYAAWLTPDYYIHTARLGIQSDSDQTGGNWTEPVNTGFKSSHAPSIASHGGTLYLAWKDFDQGLIYWAPGSWAGFEIGTRTSWKCAFGPVIGSSLFRGLSMAWVGIPPDDRLRWVPFDHQTDTFPDAPLILEGRSSAAPALVGTLGRYHLAWKGSGQDRRLWWSCYGGEWSPQQPMDGWSTTGPGLAANGEDVYLTYTEQHPQDGNGQIYWTRTTPPEDVTLPPAGWTAHLPLTYRQSFVAPAIA